MLDGSVYYTLLHSCLDEISCAVNHYVMLCGTGKSLIAQFSARGDLEWVSDQERMACIMGSIERRPQSRVKASRTINWMVPRSRDMGRGLLHPEETLRQTSQSVSTELCRVLSFKSAAQSQGRLSHANPSLYVDVASDYRVCRPTARLGITTAYPMGRRMDDIHAPTVQSGPTSGPSASASDKKLSFRELVTQKENVEAELSALGSVLDSVSASTVAYMLEKTVLRRK
nr:hypothetical protein CFP56_53339 [Quercus suber]